MRRLHYSIVLLVFLSVTPSLIRAQSTDTVYYGDLITLSAFLPLSDSCQWTDTSRLRFASNLLESEIVVNSPTFDTAVPITFHGFMLITTHTSANLSCGMRQMFGDQYVTAVDRISGVSGVLPALTITPVIESPFSFRLSSPISTSMEIALFNYLGKQMAHANLLVSSGISEITLAAPSLPAGSYWYVARAGEWMRSGKLVKIYE